MNRIDYMNLFCSLWIIWHTAKDMEYNVKEKKEWRHIFIPAGMFAALWIGFPFWLKLLTK